MTRRLALIALLVLLALLLVSAAVAFGRGSRPKLRGVTLGAAESIGVGMTEAQVIDLLGPPHTPVTGPPDLFNRLHEHGWVWFQHAPEPIDRLRTRLPGWIKRYVRPSAPVRTGSGPSWPGVIVIFSEDGVVVQADLIGGYQGGGGGVAGGTSGTMGISPPQRHVTAESAPPAVPTKGSLRLVNTANVEVRVTVRRCVGGVIGEAVGDVKTIPAGGSEVWSGLAPGGYETVACSNGYLYPAGLADVEAGKTAEVRLAACPIHS